MLDNGDAERVVINVERVKYWLERGAKATERIALFLANLGVIEKTPYRDRPKKSAPRKKS
jgi:small subunit ribosomal protein S16